jgi:hypothetical protein
MIATYRNSSGLLNAMLTAWPPPIDRPAMARSAGFFETLKDFSTITVELAEAERQR